MCIALVLSTIFVLKFLLGMVTLFRTLQSKMLMFVLCVYTLALVISLLLERLLIKHNNDFAQYLLLLTLGMFCGFIISCPVFLSNNYFYSSLESEFMLDEEDDDDDKSTQNLMFFIGFTFLFGILALVAFMKT
jgi:hypothetical protein